MTLCMFLKLEPQERICDTSAALSQNYCMFSGAGNKKLLRIKTIIRGWFQQETEENTSTDFSLSNTKSNRCFCCCNWHKREKQFDLLSLSLKSAYLNLIFHLSLLVVKSEFGMQLRDYKKNWRKNQKQHSGKSKTSWLLWNMFSGYHFKCPHRTLSKWAIANLFAIKSKQRGGG